MNYPSEIEVDRQKREAEKWANSDKKPGLDK